MRLHSDTRRTSPQGVSALDRLPQTIVHWLCLILPSIALAQTLDAQIRTWSVTGSVGYGMLHLDGVDAKNQSDVEGWNTQGIPIGPLESLKQSPYYTAEVSYRIEREFAFSLSGSYWSKTVSSSYISTDATLQLDRGVGLTDIALGIIYYPANQPLFFEWYFQTNFGLTMARATSKAVGSSLKKIGGVLTLAPLVNTDGTYKKNKLSVSFAVGVDRQLVSILHLRVEAGYRFAQMGTMDGDVSSFGVQTTETSTTEFDYSGILISAGLAFEF